MLSICIPIYQFDCSDLIRSLSKQIQATKEEVELIVFDDHSNEDIKAKLEKLSDLCALTFLNQNVGRARIRNLMAEKARYNYLLFIDGDSSIISADFIDKYIQLIHQSKDIDVICGGSIYSDEPPAIENLLRWRYSKSREGKEKEFLEKKPYQSFTTNNFIIQREVFLQIKFDERIRDYGHEDTLFGYELKRRKKSVVHFENPVLNGDLDSNPHFLNKTRLSLRNLLKIESFIEDPKEFRAIVPILKLYRTLFNLGLMRLYSFILRLFKNRLVDQLIRGKGKLIYFDLYRLDVLFEEQRRTNSFES